VQALTQEMEGAHEQVTHFEKPTRPGVAMNGTQTNQFGSGPDAVIIDEGFTLQDCEVGFDEAPNH
jgi:hypothetical protein